MLFMEKTDIITTDVTDVSIYFLLPNLSDLRTDILMK